MKIIVLAGGLSTERDVSLSSAAGICRTLVEKGHDAFLPDVFMGLENAPENLEDRLYSFLRIICKPGCANHAYQWGVKNWDPPCKTDDKRQDMPGSMSTVAITD